MHSTVQNLLDIETNIKTYLNKINIHKKPKIVAVSKTFKIDKIMPLIQYGHIDYGENNDTTFKFYSYDVSEYYN